MIFDSIKIRAISAPWHRGIEFQVTNETKDGVRILNEGSFKELNPNEIIDPSFTVSVNDAQTLMDDLWMAGLRPTEGTGSAGALSATQKHLDDMRKLVFESFIKKD